MQEHTPTPSQPPAKQREPGGWEEDLEVLQVTELLEHLNFLRKIPINTDISNQLMSFCGSTDPCAICFLYSIGKIGELENKVCSKLLCDLLNKQLKIPSDSICLPFQNVSASNLGWDTTTFV
ncbi:macrophage migration inhibitory factor-like [Heliangelus exortis]|uniref:macrophage migration inhibitory factor-like n=1 Tax=Heliangelus exortis TaxID=472823 RepID=UPI003A90432E